MKKLKYTFITLMVFSIVVNAQVGIEIATPTEISPKAIMDFPDNADGGILLPYVNNPSSTAGTEGGTILYNATDGRIYYMDKANVWTPLTNAPQDTSVIAKHDTSSATGFEELNANGIIISDGPITNSREGKGVLELDSSNKALALPKVNSVKSIESPQPGLICYDVSRKALAIFNGEIWVFRNYVK